MSVKFRCMLADKYSEKHLKFPVAIEPKYDGVRALSFSIQNGFAPTLGLPTLITRTGKPIPSISDEMREALKTLATTFPSATVFDGELISGTATDSSFNVTVGDVRRHAVNDDLIYHIFDCVPAAAFPNWVHGGEHAPHDVSYLTRRKNLENAFLSAQLRHDAPLRLVPMQVVTNHDEVEATYQEFRALGYEGAMLKSLTGGYHPRRSRDWMKLKAHETEDLIVIGFEEGTGKAAGMLGALQCQRGKTSVGVGTGFTDEQRIQIWKHRQAYLGTYAEVGFQHATDDGSLRHPAFVRFRPDKDPA